MRLRDGSTDILKRIEQAGSRDTTVSKARPIDAPSRITGKNSPLLVGRPQVVTLPGRQSANMVPLSEDSTAAIFRFHAADAEQVIRVMIAAASADGVVDERERRRIADYLSDAGSTPAEMSYANEQLRKPAMPHDFAGAVTSREVAIELYAAALLVAAEETPGNRAFQGSLASALQLEPKFVADLHAAWGMSPPVPVGPPDQPSSGLSPT